ncbi:ABC transporter, ATP-binding protein [Cystobacter fuscus DSM 2262]|uniref:ABC transporter, ATP-binding protein n=1 Tax=Cystobacter fuscus (strain ATCC 25194 / DSM 2262 / NBRC 100088 / M29) TaxID=1242864 RepID=S9QAL5_CYSF2|nr:ABC transporter ATP-binding protein [Cystobacter fuscus]EPX58379.1 ABC transporter, ATP-binding protein [Cystobacter fuscus DSM 2262]
MSEVTAPVLRVGGLEKTYGEVKAVQGVTFQLAPGEVLGLVGPNGAGKTTTLRCLAGILPPSAGRITVAGYDLAQHPVEAKRSLAFLPDEPRLFEYLTVWEHLNFVARLYGVEDWEPRARALLDEMELVGKEKALPGELSRGMKQKLSIACGFLHTPRLIILDEPLTGLDPLAIRRMKASLRRRAEEGTALVLSSHLLPLVEELCHRLLVIAGGRVVALGTLPEIRARLSGPEAAGASLEELFIRITSAAPGPEREAP